MIHLFDRYHDNTTAGAMAVFAGIAAAIDTAGGFAIKALATCVAAGAAGFGYKLGSWIFVRLHRRLWPTSDRPPPRED